MKKIVVILLLVLPFILIYSISFTGKIVSKYTHVYVERIAILDEEEKEYDNDAIVKLNKGETFILKVKVFPELASNKDYTITNSDKEVCEIDQTNGVITAKEYGVSQIIISSKDTQVKFSFCVKVSDDFIQSIKVSKTEVRLGVSKTEMIDMEILPITTLPEYRNVIWFSDNESIATVNANGEIKGVSVGETFVTVKSTYNEEIFAKIKVVVSNDVFTPVKFTVASGTYVISNDTIDLNAITEINVSEYFNLKYKLTSGESKADVSRINEGVIKFNDVGVFKIEVSLIYDGQTFTDKLTVLYRK